MSTNSDPALASFETILASEHASINQRRQVNKKNPVQPFRGWEVKTSDAVTEHSAGGDVQSQHIPPQQTESQQTEARQPETQQTKVQQTQTRQTETQQTETQQIYDTIGLALSGGGIRSAAFCLGALQALEVSDAFKSIDYLSTVSGGGYIGASLSAAMSESIKEGAPNEFPFESKLSRDETPIVQHIRDYSNYLVPHGSFDVLVSVAIYFRGVAANVLLVLPWLLFAAAVTICLKPTLEKLQKEAVLSSVFPEWAAAHFFALTALLLLVYLLSLIIWSLWKSAQWNLSEPEVPGASRFFGLALIVILLCFLCEVQPYVLAELFSTAKATEQTAGQGTGGASVTVLLIKGITAALAPIAVGVGFLGNKIGSFITKVTETDAFRTRALAAAGRVLMFVPTLFVPLLLWVVYLQLCYWGISKQIEHWSLEGQWQSDYNAPAWMKGFPALLPDFLYLPLPSPIAQLYVYGWLVLFFCSAFLSPNANSLHRLYRDRLSKAFIVCPVHQLASGAEPIRTIDKVKLSELNTERSPYHLLNAALNVQASRYANRRGRNADFFLLTRNYIGSATTGYVGTTEVEAKVPEVDLATAMAISGAAASSNMGSSSIKQWTLLLAMLNVRLGYWLRNPKYIAGRNKLEETFHALFSPYFLYEAFGLLNESRWFVNLSDGGHIENLGVYELLRRRCKLIIVIDAEADPRMNFGSLVTLERYARIDLGVRIELPWGKIRAVTLQVGQQMQANDGVPLELLSQAGPHCAVGRIFYPEGEGRLLYVKASVSGDESDYVMDYKRRHASFPHETTGDQFFTEEQFEAYRALGFHAVQGFFSGRDQIATFDDPTIKIIDQVKNALSFTPPKDVLPTLPK